MTNLNAMTQKISKKTKVIEHRAYQSIFAREYNVFDDLLDQVLSDTSCKTDIYLQSLQKETLFKKGKFIGHFDYKCYDNSISDINVFLDVYAYDEISISAIEVKYSNGKREFKKICWSHYSDFVSCERYIDENNIKYNFN